MCKKFISLVYSLRMNAVIRWIASLLVVGAIIFFSVNIIMRRAMGPYMYNSIDAIPSAQVAVVLGASVVHGKPSPVLAARADAAIALYKAKKVEKILVTGDNGEDRYDEVTPVRKYLTDAGVPDDVIFLDHAGFDTYSSMYRARSVFQADTMIIVTQDFHMPRALFIARHLGISAVGYIAQDQGSQTSEYVREIPASIKALWDIYTNRVPRYLGNAIPLDGQSGTSTWY
jgi:SanA protein